MADALDRYLERPDADERVAGAAYCCSDGVSGCAGCPTCDSCRDDETRDPERDGLLALAEKLEEAEGHIRGLLPCASPDCCSGTLRGMCTATAACDFVYPDLRAHYREGAK